MIFHLYKLLETCLKRAFLTILILFCLAMPCLAQGNPTPIDRTQGAPAASSVPAATTEYLVGPADILDINVWKEPELSKSLLAVRPDGMISMPLIGVVMVSGLTPSQIQDLLAEKLHRFLSVAQVTVTVAEIKSKVVYITGEINKPGVYPIITPTDVLQLIIKAGGLTPFARSKSIVILRVADGKQQKLTVNYKKLLQGAYLDQNIFLLPGDTVVVP